MLRSSSIGHWPKEQVVAMRVLTWVQTLSGIKNSCKKIFKCTIPSTRMGKIYHYKDFFTNYFYILNQGIIAAIYRKRLIKKPRQNFMCLKPAKKHVLSEAKQVW